MYFYYVDSSEAFCKNGSNIYYPLYQYPNVTLPEGAEPFPADYIYPIYYEYLSDGFATLWSNGTYEHYLYDEYYFSGNDTYFVWDDTSNSTNWNDTSYFNWNDTATYYNDTNYYTWTSTDFNYSDYYNSIDTPIIAPPLPPPGIMPPSNYFPPMYNGSAINTTFDGSWTANSTTSNMPEFVDKSGIKVEKYDPSEGGLKKYKETSQDSLAYASMSSQEEPICMGRNQIIIVGDSRWAS